jgi:hypothetical protein
MRLRAYVAISSLKKERHQSRCCRGHWREMHKPARIVEDTERDARHPRTTRLNGTYYSLVRCSITSRSWSIAGNTSLMALRSARMLHIGGDFFLYFHSHLFVSVSAKRVHLLPLVGRPGTSSRRFLMFFLDLDLAFIFLSIARAPTAQALTVWSAV